ncbi:TATA-box-binding protein 1 [Eurytemora carolleeae]|uniref:TATA-box-binding protein 1 n=1 Tax=Eurytemora carolleeae TaxID=1294199 RepID=UPI000C773489|nr:TATA-box-binding protein 1 [Eurytemora carolleeae]|eukprot:XP_023342345.1 TATA-box-binding protein 1-like [Eurytemora affinis]
MYQNRVINLTGIPPAGGPRRPINGGTQGHSIGIATDLSLPRTNNTVPTSGHILPGQVYSQPYSSIHSSVIPPLIPSNSTQPSSHSIQLHSGGAGIHGSIQGLQRGSVLQGGPIQGLQGGPGVLHLVRGNSNGSATANTSSYNGSQGVSTVNGGEPSKLEIKEETEEITPKEDEPPEMDIFINNVVCSFSVRCHLNLKEIALTGSNVEYRRENGMVTMKLRHPYTTASIWSSGKITCTGANTEDDARIAARKFSRILQRLDEKYQKIRIKNWRIVNVLGTCNLPFGIKIVPFSQAFREASYEPELHPGVTYKLKQPKATLKIFSTGSITVTAPSVANVQAAVEHIYPKVK